MATNNGTGVGAACLHHAVQDDALGGWHHDW